MRMQRKQKVIEVTTLPYDTGDLKAGDGLITLFVESDGDKVPTPEQRHVTKEELEADWEPTKVTRRRKARKALSLNEPNLKNDEETGRIPVEFAATADNPKATGKK